MPLYSFSTVSAAVCLFFSAALLVGDEPARRFVVPENESQVSFAPIDPPRLPKKRSEASKLQLQSVADGFSSNSFHLPAEPAPVQNHPVIHAAGVSSLEPSHAPVIRQVAAEVAMPAPSEPVEEPAESDDPLDKRIGFKQGIDPKDKLTKPDFSKAVAPMISVFGSLLVVLSAFLLLILLLKKVSPKGMRTLPVEAFENLGRTQLAPKLQLHLLRLGNRLILVSATQDGVTPVTEVTDPDEVVALLGMCRKLDPDSSSQSFIKTLSELGRADKGYFAAPSPQSPPSPKGATLDIYSEPGESLADILAAAKGGRNG